MKRVITGVIAGIVLGSASAAFAVSNFSHRMYGVWCKSDSGSKSIACVKENGNGYGVGINKDFVMVMNSNGKIIFVRSH